MGERVVLDALAASIVRDHGLEPRIAQQLVDRHGTEASAIVALGIECDLLRPLGDGIAQLEPAYRIVFQLRDIEELSTEETARLLGLSVPAVKSRLLRARLKLRHTLDRLFRGGARSELQGSEL